jgi:U3 small nucleolar ribonucleoprotein protein IMP3
MSSMRKLKFHEKKLLKKVNLYAWKNENNLREIKVMRRYHVQNRDDYVKYNRLCGMVRKVHPDELRDHGLFAVAHAFL